MYEGVWVELPKIGGCCDCGLIHRYEYRIKDGKIEQKVKVDNKLTKIARGHTKKKEPDFLCSWEDCESCQNFRRLNKYTLAKGKKMFNK